MRWTRLFDDLEAQVRRLEQDERAAEIAEQSRAARGRVELVEALAADRGRQVSVRAHGVGRVTGTVAEVGQDWFTVDIDVQAPQRRRSVLLPLSSVQTVSGLSGFVDQRDSVSSRHFGLRLALRALSRDRATVRVHLVDDTVLGTIDRVAQDHIDVSAHPDDVPPRRGQVRTSVAVPFWSICAVRQI
ncbi:MAG TPA: hypothetical protein VJ976_09440 [Ornithinimicrobium sp.]|uniref:hypothetical protein n=1 Tax=Ornithinimicrobium sp. TaxID=1977084 RepID=UPI002B490953|nr:hypothetical protein [Ornithinimicrobium sp.]HKJ12591.1 hypothetical protein [Ornithinimicrobium sp.]